MHDSETKKPATLAAVGNTSVRVEVIRQRWLSASDIAKLISVTRRTVEAWVRDERLPPPDVRLHFRCVRWKLETIERWMAEMEAKTQESIGV